MKDKIYKRGPDFLEVTAIDMFKIISEEVKLECMDENTVPS